MSVSSSRVDTMTKYRQLYLIETLEVTSDYSSSGSRKRWKLGIGPTKRSFRSGVSGGNPEKKGRGGRDDEEGGRGENGKIILRHCQT